MLFSYSKSINLPYSKLSEKLSKNNQNQTDSQVLGSISKFLPKVFKLLGFSIFAFVIFSLSDQNGIKVFAENPEINVQIQNETPDSQSNSQAGNNLITNVKKTQKYNSEIQEMLDLINQERIKNGTGILKTQKNLVRASDYFADYLATRDLDGSFFDHTEKSGRGPWERCRDFE